MKTHKIRWFLSLARIATAQSSRGPLREATLSDDCHNACTALTVELGENAFYGSLPDDFASSYFCGQQQEVIPACVVRPTSAEEVSLTLKTITKYDCHFAVKSGGHGNFRGVSNADGGITIDLSRINEIEVSEDRETTRLGSGQRWGKVYEVLEPQGLTVVGGRDPDVGVGGFLLGGGLSFLSRRHGWAMDNVRNYRVILANGSITNANPKSNPELYWALRGGGSNFGIVTQFDLETYPQMDVWGGTSFFMLSDLRARREAVGIKRAFTPTVSWLTMKLGKYVSKIACMAGFCNEVSTFLNAIEHLASEKRGVDPFSQLHMSVGCVPAMDICLGTAFITHSGAVIDPPSFSDFKTLKSVYSTNRVTNISSLVNEIGSWLDPGYRQYWKGMTIKANAQLLSDLFDIFIYEIDAVKYVPGFLPSFVMQPISQIAVPGSTKNGGNPLGITEEDGPLLMWHISPRWSNAEDDEVMNKAMGKIVDRAVALAKERGLYHPFIYQNYAHKGQDVFAGYGEKNREKLRKIQKDYDPEGVFSRLQPGYFKF